MIKTDIDTFGNGDFRLLEASVMGLLNGQGYGTIRLDEGTSVGLQHSRRRYPKVGITLLDRNVEKVGDNTEFYPYTRLIVASVRSRAPQFTEEVGLQTRTEKGTLIDYHGGDTTNYDKRLSRQERREFRDKPTAEAVMPIDLVQYFNPLDRLENSDVDADREDLYGRIPAEQAAEAEVIQEFDERTNLLLLPGVMRLDEIYRRLGGTMRGRYHRAFRPGWPKMLYSLPDLSGLLLVKEEKQGQWRSSREVVVYVIKNETRGEFFDASEPTVVWQYKKRNGDGRLGVAVGTNVPYFTHYPPTPSVPVDAVDGRAFNNLLRSVGNTR